MNERHEWQGKQLYRNAYIRNTLQDELCEQMEEIKEAYEDMRRGYEAEATLLREEIHDLQQNLDRETRNRRQLEDTRRENTRLLQEKTKVSTDLINFIT